MINTDNNNNNTRLAQVISLAFVVLVMAALFIKILFY